MEKKNTAANLIKSALKVTFKRVNYRYSKSKIVYA